MILPDLTDYQLKEVPSSAEVKVYCALRDNLDDEYVVLFQVGWIIRIEEEKARDGETDFLICHPEHGYFCLEVKGGGIGFNGKTGDWYSIDRNHTRHLINNPINQALKAKYSIRNKLNENHYWRNLGLNSVNRGHAVFFPDISNVDSLSRPDMPAVLIGCSENLIDIKNWVEGVFSYWRGNNSKNSKLGSKGIDVIRNTFARSFIVTPLVSQRLKEQESRRLKLTNEQIRLLDLLMTHRRVAITGGAGTGKTVLAVEKAKRLANEGFITLLVCYNRQLADFLANICDSIENLSVMSFHQLCYRRVEKANQISGRDLLNEAKLTYPGKDVFDIQLPNALAYSLDVIPERYDAIVCDEGQDFREEYWVPLELLLSDYEKSPLYVFYDDNQNIYSRAGTFPIRDEPFSLTVNCRNTSPIHIGAYKYYKGIPVIPPDLDGDEIHFDIALGRDTQAAKINARIVDLIAKQGVSSSDITVLVADAIRKTEYYKMLKCLPLPKPAIWHEEGLRSDNTVLLDTIQRFKGLESPVVFLWGLDTLDLLKNNELLYVGMSRAKSLLVIVANHKTCKEIQDIEI